MKRLLLAAAALLLRADAFAWGPDGHAVVALIAQRRLTPKAASAVRALLGDGVGLDRIASCADWMRDEKKDVPCAGFTLPYTEGTEAWHVLAVPLSASPEIGDLDAYCQANGACPMAQIKRHLAVLRDAAVSRRDKQRALAFVVHLVGDLHQPLHCAADRDDGPFRKRFGNTRPVVFFGKSMNLHHLWDILIENDRAASYGSAQALAERLDAGLGDKTVDASDVGHLLDAAASESFALAKDVYAGCVKNDGRPLSEEYKRKMQPIVFGRLELAGARLAVLLNDALR